MKILGNPNITSLQKAKNIQVSKAKFFLFFKWPVQGSDKCRTIHRKTTKWSLHITFSKKTIKIYTKKKKKLCLHKKNKWFTDGKQQIKKINGIFPEYSLHDKYFTK